MNMNQLRFNRSSLYIRCQTLVLAFFIVKNKKFTYVMVQATALLRSSITLLNMSICIGSYSSTADVWPNTTVNEQIKTWQPEPQRLHTL